MAAAEEWAEEWEGNLIRMLREEVGEDRKRGKILQLHSQTRAGVLERLGGRQEEAGGW